MSMQREEIPKVETTAAAGTLGERRIEVMPDKEAKNEPLEPGDLLRVEEAARIATVRPSTIRSWLTKGKLPRLKIGGCTRILREDLEQFIRAGRTVGSK